ncbi:MAG: OmpA family protein [Bacteriovoracaceae bacterium]|nr:OmpA family protein [Bacteriovoracaceae bacterium]
MKKIVMGLMMIASLAIHAEDLTGKFGAGLGLGYNMVLGPNALEKAADPDLGIGAWFRYHFNNQLAGEFSYDRLEYDISSVNSGHYHLGALYYFMQNSKWRPLVGLGAGVSTFSNYGTGSDGDLIASLKAKLGIETFVTENLVVSGLLNLIHVKDTHRKEASTLVPMVGLTYYFGGKKTKEAPKEEVAPVVEEQKVVAAEPTPVVLDDDQDGILNDEDKCPTTALGTAVNAYGCAKAEKATIRLNVQFETAKSIIRSQYEGNIKDVANFLKQYVNVKAEIAGHTDSVGSLKYNTVLSAQRAQAVMNTLVKKYGIEKERLTAKGFGPAKPIADNATEEGKTLNRRVEAVITE